MTRSLRDDVPLRPGYDRPLLAGETPAFAPDLHFAGWRPKHTTALYVSHPSNAEPSRVAREIKRVIVDTARLPPPPVERLARDVLEVTTVEAVVVSRVEPIAVVCTGTVAAVCEGRGPSHFEMLYVRKGESGSVGAPI